jgi:hypothetical protein
MELQLLLVNLSAMPILPGDCTENSVNAFVIGFDCITKARYFATPVLGLVRISNNQRYATPYRNTKKGTLQKMLSTITVNKIYKCLFLLNRSS